MEQSKLLREWMRVAVLTRDQAAEKLGIKRRRLDTWLLPEDSSGRRSADDGILDRVQELLQEANAIAKRSSTGEFTVGQEPTNPFHLDCAGNPVLFPAIYRAKVVVIDTFTEQLMTYTAFAFSEEQLGLPRGTQEVTQVDRLDPTIDQGSLALFRLNSLAEVDGFLMAHTISGTADIHTCLFNGEFFAMHHNIEPGEHLEGFITYAARFETTLEHIGHVIDFDTAAVGPDGEETFVPDP